MLNRKHYLRTKEEINREYKGRDSKKELLMGRLETKYMYSIPRKSACPVGLSVERTSDVIGALSEAETIFYQLSSQHDMFANIRFYICNPYFSRTSVEPFPCYSWEDEQVRNICSLVRDVMKRYNVWRGTEGLNIIIRCYRAGDTLGFHTDRPEFGDVVGGILLLNRCPQHGLKLVHGASEYMLDERAPMSWLLRDEARWSWQHGYAAPEGTQRDIVRISVTFRYATGAPSLKK